MNLVDPFVAGHGAQMLEYRVFIHGLTPSSRACSPSYRASSTPLRKSAADVLAASTGDVVPHGYSKELSET
jgi:hypothetical protein